MKRKSARQQREFNRDCRDASPWKDAVKRKQDTCKHVAFSRPAPRQHCFARAPRVRRIGAVADHLEGEIGLDAGAHVELALMIKGPAAMCALDTTQVDCD